MAVVLALYGWMGFTAFVHQYLSFHGNRVDIDAAH